LTLKPLLKPSSGGDRKTDLQGKEGNKVRLGPESGDYEELVLAAEGVRVQGCVVYGVHPPRRKSSGGGT
jgi:hypothetical protein